MKSEIIDYTCTRCGYSGKVDLSELVGMPIKDSQGNVIDSHPPITPDGCIIIVCDNCDGPTTITFED